MRKLISLSITIALLLSLTACGNTNAAAETESNSTESTISAVETDSSESTLSGTISAIEGEAVTITTDDGSEATFTVSDATTYSFEMGNMPSGDMPQGGTPPEMPSDSSQQGGTPPEMPADGSQQGGTPPEMPADSGQQGGTPPEMPADSSQQGGTPPEMPAGSSQQGGTPPEMPSGDMQQGGGMDMQADFSMLTVGSEVTVTIDAEGMATEVAIRMNGNPGGFGGGDTNIAYTAANTFSEDTTVSGQTYESTGTDENAILVTDGTVSIEDAAIDRTSSDSTGGDNASFYGVGAAVLTTDGSVSISDSTISTDAAGGTGVFAYGNGTAYVSDTTITTQQNTSGGIHVAGGGTLYAWDLDVETNGESAAAIRSDRGSGTMVIDGGTYTSNGIGSPAVYSTADITIHDAELSANGSEAICIEGKNCIRLFDCDLSGNMSDDSRNDCTWNVILYQSMSGDSDVGNSLFEMDGGTLTANNGGIFYTTNTESTFVLSDVEIVASDDCPFFLKCTGNSNQRGWGTAGANGAQCTFTAVQQAMAGDVIWDSISTLDFYMTEESTLTGAFLNDETNAGNGGDGYANLNISEGSTWVVTKDSTLSSLTTSGSIVDENGKTVSVVGTDGSVYVDGESELTVTVSSFSDQAELSGCGTVSDFSTYEVSRA